MEDRFRAISLIGLCRRIGVVVIVAFWSLVVGYIPVLRQRRRVQLGRRRAWTITARGWRCDRRLLSIRLRLVKTGRRMVLRRLCGGGKVPVVGLVLLSAGNNGRIGQVLLLWVSIRV